MATIDGRGKLLIASGILDETGKRIFSGKFNEYGHIAMGIRIFTVTLTETIHVADNTFKRLTRSFSESVKATVIYLAGLNRTLTENIQITMDKSSTLTRNIVESVLLSVGRTTKLTRVLEEQVVVTIDMWLRRVIYFIEHVHLGDAIGAKTITRTLTESVHSTINRTTELTRNLTEQINILDTLIRARVVTFIETINISDTITKKVTRTLSELVKITVTFSGATTQFIMRLKNTKLVSVYRNAQTRLVQQFTRSTSIYDHTNVSLEDGRDVK